MSGARRSAGWVPEQHGAWAMVTVPVLTGVALAGPHWVHLPLVLVWWTVIAVTAWASAHRRDRSLLKDAVTIAAAGLMTAGRL